MTHKHPCMRIGLLFTEQTTEGFPRKDSLSFGSQTRTKGDGGKGMGLGRGDPQGRTRLVCNFQQHQRMEDAGLCNQVHGCLAKEKGGKWRAESSQKPNIKNAVSLLQSQSCMYIKHAFMKLYIVNS